MEEKILYLFQEKLDKLPIAQNILICSSETSIEKMQSFFYRAILCDYNTLFIIEIFESFSSFQHNKMYSYIDRLLSYKLEKTRKENKENKNINKLNSREYLNSCIYFVYKNLENEASFKNELEKYTIRNRIRPVAVESSVLNDLDISNIENVSNNSEQSRIFIQDNTILENIKVLSSEVCGLGKSFKIKKTIIKNGELYYHFPLGGRLTKRVIYEKLSDLLKRIKKDDKIKKEQENKKNKINKKEDDDDDEMNLTMIMLQFIKSNRD